jgi:hypothetical protein
MNRPMRDFDEDPDDDDLDEFGGDTITCPACQSDIWHDSVLCPKCGEVLEDEQTCCPRRGSRRRSAPQQKLNNVIIMLLILGMIFGCSLYGVLRYW